jgi:hypothetical protein
MSPFPNLEQTTGGDVWFMLIQVFGVQGHGMNAIEADQYFKVLFKLSSTCADKVGKPAEHLFYLVALIRLKATNMVVHLKCFKWFNKNRSPTCRLVVEDPLDTVSVGLFHRKNPSSLSHGDQVFLQDACAPQPVKQGLQLFSQPFPCMGHLAANGGQIRARLVTNFQGLQINTLVDFLHKSRLGRKRCTHFLKHGKTRPVF